MKAFLIREAGLERRSLRRFSRAGLTCTDVRGYHDAQFPIGKYPTSKRPDGVYDAPPADPQDPRWPTRCDACAYTFTSYDPFQVFCDQVYVDDAGREYSLRERPRGALYYAPWLFDPMRPDELESLPERIAHARSGGGYLSLRYLERDAKHRAPLMAVLPNGDEWCIDSKANNGPGWELSGEAPNLTAHPSIQSPGYHGWLREGVFSPA